MFKISNTFEGQEVKLILGLFVSLFVICVVIFSLLLLKSPKPLPVNVVESENYDKSIALVNNSGVTNVTIPAANNNKNQEPVFPDTNPSQNYVIPDTGYLDSKIYLYALLFTLPFLLFWIFTRIIVVKKI